MKFMNLKAEMVRNGLTVKDISTHLNITDKSLRNKLSGSSDFTLSQAYKIKTVFFPKLSTDYLFETNQGQAN